MICYAEQVKIICIVKIVSNDVFINLQLKKSVNVHLNPVYI